MAKASHTALCQLGEEREVLLQDPLQVWSRVDNLFVGTGGSSYKYRGLCTAMTPLPAGPSEHPLLSFAFPVLRERQDSLSSHGPESLAETPVGWLKSWSWLRPGGK